MTILDWQALNERLGSHFVDLEVFLYFNGIGSQYKIYELQGELEPEYERIYSTPAFKLYMSMQRSCKIIKICFNDVEQFN